MAVTRKKASEQDSSSDRKKCREVFDTLVLLINKQHSHIVCLAQERSLLEDRLRLQHDKWESDVGSLKDLIIRKKGKLKLGEMVQSFDLAKLDLVLALKEKELIFHKLKSGQAGDELTDLKSCLDILSRKCSDSGRNEETNQKSANEVVRLHIPTLEDEVRRLRLEYDKLVEEKNSEVSALLSEKNFVWNQYKIFETDLNNKLKSKSLDVEHANENISNVLVSMEEFQRRNCEKDDEIAKLKKKVIEMEDALGKKNNGLGRLTLELDSSSKSMVTRQIRCSSDRKGSVTGSLPGEIKKEKTASQWPLPLKDYGKGGRSSKRKDVTVIFLDDTSKLFSSSFKVPKLRSSVVR